jgi:hypothetical protein
VAAGILKSTEGQEGTDCVAVSQREPGQGAVRTSVAMSSQRLVRMAD